MYHWWWLGRIQYCLSPFQRKKKVILFEKKFLTAGASRATNLTPEASIHGIINQGGERTNIIPELAQCRFSIRAPSVAYRDEIVKKVRNCAKGAALAIGCEVNFGHFDRVYEPMRLNPPLERAFLDNLESLDLEVSRTIEQSRGSTDAQT
jgi:metal-dependent amidase/aminoacylase/carboxypeptidase family protein